MAYVIFKIYASDAEKVNEESDMNSSHGVEPMISSKPKSPGLLPAFCVMNLSWGRDLMFFSLCPSSLNVFIVGALLLRKT